MLKIHKKIKKILSLKDIITLSEKIDTEGVIVYDNFIMIKVKKTKDEIRVEPGTLDDLIELVEDLDFNE